MSQARSGRGGLKLETASNLRNLEHQRNPRGSHHSFAWSMTAGLVTDTGPAQLLTEVAERAGVSGGGCYLPNNGSEQDSSANQDFRDQLGFSAIVVGSSVRAAGPGEG
jgi:hypothetical protein